MVDYEPSPDRASPDRAKVNVAYLSIDYYVMGDNLMGMEFNFAAQNVVFHKTEDFDNNLKNLI